MLACRSPCAKQSCGWNGVGGECVGLGAGFEPVQGCVEGGAKDWRWSVLFLRGVGLRGGRTVCFCEGWFSFGTEHVVIFPSHW